MKNNSVFIIHSGKPVLYEDFKVIAQKQAGYIKAQNPQKVVLSGDDSYILLVNLFACMYLNIPVQLIPDKTKLKYAEGLYIDNLYEGNQIAEDNLQNDFLIEFLTSGSTSEPKIVKKTLANIFAEAKVISKTFDFSDIHEFETTASLTHLYGFTFCFAIPYINEKPICVDRISFPEQITKGHSVLVSTPSFLSKVAKYNIIIPTMPLYIISAGAKFDTIEYFERRTNVIEIYGATETGIVAYRQSSKENLKLFDDVKIKDDTVCSPYIYENEYKLDDSVKITDDGIQILSRKDRVVKIQEKRVSLLETEKNINQLEYIKGCYTLKYGEKLACVAVLSESGVEQFLKLGKIEFVKQLKKELRNYLDIIPQKWKFVDEIPKNNMGKMNLEYMKDLFGVRLSLPLVISREKTMLGLVFHRDCNFFKGHFKDYPIVPGVVQLYYASFYIKELFGYKVDVGQLKKIKFSNIIKPDKKISLSFTENANSILYKYFDDDKVYSSGQLPKENIFRSK